MTQDLFHTRPETINSYVNSRSLKYRKNKKVNTLTNAASTSVNKSKASSSDSLPLKQDQIVKTKVTVANDFKHKIKKNKELHEPIIDTSEFKLLCKLFVPSKYLIQNDKITVKQLSNYLPLLISGSIKSNNSRYKINFEIHLLLSSIVTHYITSWYLSKLNTDNLEFVRNIYNILSNFTMDFIRRLNTTYLGGLYSLTNELFSIINNHIADLVSDSDSTHDIKIVNCYLRENMNRNTIKNANEDVNEIIKRYLADKHVIFENIRTQILSNLEMLSEKQHTSDNRIQYFRLMAKELLTTSFDSKIDYDVVNQSTPTTSHIAMTLLIILVSDTIFDNLFEKLASPQFLLATILKDIIDMIGNSTQKKDFEMEDKTSNSSTIGSAIRDIYNNITYLMSSIRHMFNTCGSHDYKNILENSLFQLIDTIMDFSGRKPLLVTLFRLIKRIIISNKLTARIFDAISRWFIYNQIAKLGVLNDEFGCKILESLREGMFRDNDYENAKENKEEQITIDTLSHKLFEIISNQLPNSVYAGRAIARSFRFVNESDEDLKRSIGKFLIIFNYNGFSKDNNLTNDVCLLNQLLVIQLIDCIISNLYPELMNK